MATRRFCDICDAPLKPEDDAPLVRELEYFLASERPRDMVAGQAQPVPDRKATAFVAITNENNHPLTDICIECKLRIVNHGEPKAPKAPIATLQPQVAADRPAPVSLYAAPAVLPTTPPPPKPPAPPVPEVTFQRSEETLPPQPPAPAA